RAAERHRERSRARPPEVLTGATELPSYRPAAEYRLPALWWALFHAPVIIFLYKTSAGIALASLSGGYRAGMLVAWALEACFLALIPFALGLLFSFNARLYRWA